MTLDITATGSSGNCCILTAGSEKLILDCGIPYKRIQAALGFESMRVTGCLITHEHNDHIQAADRLLRAGIACYMTRGTAEAKGISGHCVKHITAGELFTTGDFSVYPFRVEHDAAEPVGYLISYKPTGERLLYATDTYFLRYAFKGVHYMLVECNYCEEIAKELYENGEMAKFLYDRLITSHFSLERLKEFLKACDLSGTRRIVLLHLSDSNSDEGRMVSEIRSLTGKPTDAAAAGLRLELELHPF